MPRTSDYVVSYEISGIYIQTFEQGIFSVDHTGGEIVKMDV